MSVSVLVTRTFERGEGAEHLVRNVELAIAPFPGLHVDYADGTGEGTVAHVWVRLRGRTPGLHPPSVSVRMIPELADRHGGPRGRLAAASERLAPPWNRPRARRNRP